MASANGPLPRSSSPDFHHCIASQVSAKPSSNMKDFETRCAQFFLNVQFAALQTPPRRTVWAVLSHSMELCQSTPCVVRKSESELAFCSQISIEKIESPSTWSCCANSRRLSRTNSTCAARCSYALPKRALGVSENTMHRSHASSQPLATPTPYR